MVHATVRWSTRRIVLLVLLTGLFAGVVGSVVGAMSVLLLKTDARAVSASLAARVGNGTLDLQAARDLNLNAGHVRIVGRDGNFELEHSGNVPASTLSAYEVGTATRTPIQIGGADQDVLSLLVAGQSGQAHDLQEWAAGAQPVLAVDSRGRLRFGNVTLWAANHNGKITLYAKDPGEPVQILSRSN
jgi:hypothetical protein